jgi:uncharacterized membrane protein
MLAALQGAVRHAVYGLRGGFLVRPIAIAFALGACGVVLPRLEQASGVLEDAAGDGLPFVLLDPTTTQGAIGMISGAVMTVVAIVLSVLLVALTIASMQFSPRILTGFVEDRVNQHAIGIFLGTFLYCLGAYPTCHAGARPSACAVALLGAVLLATACTVTLVIFIHHIARSINVNFITERIALETERVIDDVTPRPIVCQTATTEHPMPSFAEGPVLTARRSGYIRFIDAERLRALALRDRVAVRVERRVGEFVPAGVPLLCLSRPRKVDADAFLDAVDLGPVRTMEQDVDFGLLQLVDIALKAISPAVNDPSTAINCIDQLSRLLSVVAAREPRPSALFEPPGVARVVFRPTSFDHLLEVAFAQIVHYGRSDFAVSLRVMRALGDIAAVTRDPRHLHALSTRAEATAAECLPHLPVAAHAKVTERLRRVTDRTPQPV